MRTTVYVATHRREDRLLTLKHPYVPIHVGKAIYSDDDYEYKGYLPELGDNTGDNISSKNKYYSELTAMYWAWKNDPSGPDDIIGLNHYRRYFKTLDAKSEELMTAEDMKSIIMDEGFDFIINGQGFDRNADSELWSQDYSIYQQYGYCHNIQDMDNAIAAIHELFPSISDKMEHYLKHTSVCCYCNMLITKKKYFDEYASFLFPVLEYVESKIPTNTYQEHQGNGARVPGYAAERLMRPWIMSTGHNAKQGFEIFWNI